MKVLVINWRDIKNPEAGGAEVYIDEILKRKPSDWEVDFVSASFKGSALKEEINGYTVFRIPNNFLFNFTFKSHWKKVLVKKGYDLVVDVVSKIPLATPRYIRQVPLMAVHYHVHGKSLFKELAFPMALYVYWMEKHLLQFYQKIPTLLIAESNQRELVEKYDFKDLNIAYPGIDLTFMRNKNPMHKSKTPTLFYFGRLKKYKRVDHVIRAFEIVRKEVPNAVLVIAGKGDDEERLRKITSELKVEESVRFLGFISEDEKGRWIAESWVFAITSEKEGWGIVVIEANAGALPAVGYRVEGIRDSIKDGYSGFLVENGNIEELAEKIKLLLTDSVLRKTMSKNALEWSARFAWENTASGFLEMADRAVRDF